MSSSPKSPESARRGGLPASGGAFGRGKALLKISVSLAIFTVAACASAHAQGGGAISGAPTVRYAQQLMVRQRYAEATREANAALQNNRGDIDALYTLAAIEQTRVLDYESYGIDGERFLSLADSLMNTLNKRQAALRGGDSVRCLFYRASIMGGIGVIQAKRGAWLDGARSAITASGMYKHVKKADPGHLGADLGLGLFDYYFGTTLKWVPFTSGSVERGLEATERALGAPFPFDHAAKSSYCWMLIDRKQYKRADSLAHSVLREIPTCTMFLRIRALIALWSGSYEDALLLGGKLKDLSEARIPVNWSDLITSYYITASARDNLGQKAEASAEADKGLALNMPPEFKDMPNVKEHIKFLTGVAGKRKGKK